LEDKTFQKKTLLLRNSIKLTSKFDSPLKVIQKVGMVASKVLQFLEGTQLYDVFNVNQLKKHLGLEAVPNPHLPVVIAEL
jgi:hypothetical protein